MNTLFISGNWKTTCGSESRAVTFYSGASLKRSIGWNFICSKVNRLFQSLLLWFRRSGEMSVHVLRWIEDSLVLRALKRNRLLKIYHSECLFNKNEKINILRKNFAIFGFRIFQNINFINPVRLTFPLLLFSQLKYWSWKTFFSRRSWSSGWRPKNSQGNRGTACELSLPLFPSPSFPPRTTLDKICTLIEIYICWNECGCEYSGKFELIWMAVVQQGCV